MRVRRILQWLYLVVVASMVLSVIPGTMSTAAPSGAQRVVVLRVYFHDYANTSHYTKTQVQNIFDNNISPLWKNISYGNMTIDANLTDLYQLPDNRSAYVDDYSDGDLSGGGKYMKLLNDAVAAVGSHADYTGVKGVLVLMADTTTYYDSTTGWHHFHRGQGNKCTLPVGSGGSSILVGCAILSENNGYQDDTRVWGRWMHELGHAFQDGGPAHPSNYDNSFELMDRLYPGQSGMFEKQDGVGFTGWLNPIGGSSNVYYTIPAASSGGTATVYAEEYQPSEISKGNRAIKVEVGSSSVYYMISVRHKLNGDDILPIPDEGVLIERVVTGGDSSVAGSPWVVVKCPPAGCNRLWHAGDHPFFSGDNVGISVDFAYTSTIAYQITVRRDQGARPDLMSRPWLSPPLNTYETSDIWVDSSCNGYSSYMFGTYTPVGDSTQVGRGNGDAPCANHNNRVYARVRNIGGATATSVNVHFQVTDPLGVGVSGATGWTDIGTANIPSLAANSYQDVFVNWTPAISLTPQQLAAGLFNFHSCIRVIIDPVLNENNTSNNTVQENFDSFFASPSPSPSPGLPIDKVITIRNDDSISKTFDLKWNNGMPPGWKVVVNNNNTSVPIPGNSVVSIPIHIVPVGPISSGQTYSITLNADYIHELKNDMPSQDPFDPDNKHFEFKELNGATIGGIVADPSKLYIDARLQRDNQCPGILVKGQLTPVPPPPPAGTQLPNATVQIDLLDKTNQIIAGQSIGIYDKSGQFSYCFQRIDSQLPPVRVNGSFQGVADPGRDVFQQPAFAQTIVASAYSYLPVSTRSYPGGW